MSHELFNERFYSFRQPAWHGLGVVSETPMSAQEAFSINPYDVHLEPMTCNGVAAENIPYRGIVRDATPDDNVQRLFGIVGNVYNLITPQEFCEIWDCAIAQPVETMGALHMGKTMFLTIKFPSLDVKGEQVDDYLLAVSPYDGKSAIELRRTFVRVVCNNTLAAAKRRSTETVRVPHTHGAAEKLTRTLRERYTAVIAKSDLLVGDFDLFASTPISLPFATNIINDVYALPLPPVNKPYDLQDDIDARQKRYEAYTEATKRDRQAVSELYQGLGMGMDSPASKGTAWGLFNSFTEWENYGRNTNTKTRATDTLFGRRFDIMETAWNNIYSAITK